MSGPFGDHDRPGPETAECLRRGQNQHRVRVDGIPRKVINQIGLEHHRLTAHIDGKEAQSFFKNLVEPLAIPFHA
jgi:hypothetical protein